VDAFEQFWIMRINCYLPKKIMRVILIGSLFNLGMHHRVMGAIDAGERWFVLI
jgi:hypothetical protein